MGGVMTTLEMALSFGMVIQSALLIHMSRSGDRWEDSKEGAMLVGWVGMLYAGLKLAELFLRNSFGG